MDRQVSIYQKDGFLYIRSSLVDSGNSGTACDPTFKTDSTDASEVGRLVLEALDSSRSGEFSRDEWAEQVKPFLKLAGEKTWTAFAKKAKAVFIFEVEPNLIEVWPSERQKNGSFSGSEAPIKYASRDAVVLGEKVFEALTESK